MLIRLAHILLTAIDVSPAQIVGDTTMLGDAVVQAEIFSIQDLDSIFQSVLAELGDGMPRDEVEPASIGQVLHVLSDHMIHAINFSTAKVLKNRAKTPPWARKDP